MLFKDRACAGTELAKLVKKKYFFTKEKPLVVSLLRGGVIVGDVLAKQFSLKHLALPVSKIPAPNNPELALGALCFQFVYWEKSVFSSFFLDKTKKDQQIKIAQKKLESYCQRFKIKKQNFSLAKNKEIFLVDDGVATGASVHAAALFLKSLPVKKIILLAPVAPLDFDRRDFNQTIFLHQDPNLLAVSRFYKNFPQVTDEEVNKIYK
jgi:predicted phosphoribosyltransferase